MKAHTGKNLSNNRNIICFNCYFISKKFFVFNLFFLSFYYSNGQINWNVSIDSMGTDSNSVFIHICPTNLNGDSGLVTFRYIFEGDSTMLDSSYSELAFQPLQSDSQVISFEFKNLQFFTAYVFKPVFIKTDSSLTSDTLYHFITGWSPNPLITYTIQEYLQPTETFVVQATISMTEYPSIAYFMWGPHGSQFFTNYGKSFVINGPITTITDTISNGIGEFTGLKYDLSVMIISSPLAIFFNSLGMFTTTGTMVLSNTSHVSDESYRLFPNPTANRFSVEVRRIGLISLYDLSGKEVLVKKVYPGVNIIERENIARGIYLLKIDQQGFKQGVAQKIIFE